MCLFIMSIKYTHSRETGLIGPQNVVSQSGVGSNLVAAPLAENETRSEVPDRQLLRLTKVVHMLAVPVQRAPHGSMVNAKYSGGAAGAPGGVLGEVLEDVLVDDSVPGFRVFTNLFNTII
ncbi:hypothetical protein JYU34_015056 [Plutella xylostella]|uniref:Uncharacterized protein n=1 Tax=Plutella xylostella TaxID=51655 RepID=A0ABQ7Q658_PLUXY|nr:hypothetical protein JYU34_015056 [Plutella xylostella]